MEKGLKCVCYDVITEHKKFVTYSLIKSVS